MSDTPETDDLARGNHVVPTDWAEQLERERDEARHEIKGWRNKWECAVEMAARAEVERDEARAQRDSFQALSQSLAEACVKLKTERDEWAKLCGQYKQERDEARARK